MKTKMKVRPEIDSPKPDACHGITQKHWFYASLKKFNDPKKKLEKTPVPQPGVSVSTKGPEETPEELLVQNPQIIAPTFYNLLKSKGFKILRETMSGSSTPQVMRSDINNGKLQTWAKQFKKFKNKLPKKNEKPVSASGKRESGHSDFHIESQFLESSARDNGVGVSRFRVALITEGLGNFKDAYYYPRESLEKALPIFEGKKIYADHPSSTEEETRPERSVKDIGGHFEKLAIEETEDGRAQLVADAVVLQDKPYEWARELMRHSVEYAKQFPDKDFVGLSINANGDSEERDSDLVEAIAPKGAVDKLKKAMEKGLSQVRYVTSISDAVSCDLVTEAGAGGRIISMLESSKEIKNET